MISRAYLSLGSNMGDRMRYLKDAADRISLLPGTSVAAVSCVYETKPVGYADQGDFFNAAAAIDTAMQPLELLHGLQEIESLLGRTRDGVRWGPRTVDIDILLYGDMEIGSSELTIPHPLMLERAFVLMPLRDVYAGGLLLGASIDRLISACADRDGIRRIGIC